MILITVAYPGQLSTLPEIVAVAGAVGVKVTLRLKLHVTLVVKEISSTAKSLPATFVFLSYKTISANELASEFQVKVNCVQLPHAAVAAALIVPIEMPLIVASIAAGFDADNDCAQKLKV